MEACVEESTAKIQRSTAVGVLYAGRSDRVLHIWRADQKPHQRAIIFWAIDFGFCSRLLC